MDELQLNVRNLYCYKCDVNFVDEDSFRNHHSSFQNNDCSSQSSQFIDPESSNSNPNPTSPSFDDVMIETDEEEVSVINTENYYDSSSSNFSFDSDDSYSPTKNKNYAPKKKKRRKTDNSPAAKKLQTTKSKFPIKSKSKYSKNENVPAHNENTHQNKRNRIKSNAPVLQPSTSINLSKYNDFIHCCKCFSTFYKLHDLIIHFDNCQVDWYDNFKDFKTAEQSKNKTSIKQEQNQNNNFPPNITTTPIATATTSKITTEMDNEILNSFFESCLYPSLTLGQEQKAAGEEEEEEERNNDSEYEMISESASKSYSESEPESKLKSRSKSKRKKPLSDKYRQLIESQVAESEYPYKCRYESCSALSFQNLYYFHRHEKEVHNTFPNSVTSRVCPTCGKSFTKTANFLYHLNAHTGYKPYKCNFEACDRTFLKRHQYIIHYRTHDTKKQCKCTEDGCTESFTRKSLLKDHVDAVHLGLINYVCEQCKKQFKNRDRLTTHVKKVHQERKFKCEVENCGKLFKNTKHVKSHQLSHQVEKPVECDVPGCGTKFKTTKAALFHKRMVHERKEQRLCPECGKTCATPGTYKLHLRTHTKEKPFVCHLCGWAFASGHALKRHAITHSEKKTEKCRFCDKCFVLRCTRRRHEQTHTKLNPYKCAFCDVCFPDNRPLKKHVVLIHMDEDFDLNNTSTYQREKPQDVWKQSKSSGALEPTTNNDGFI